MLDDVDDFSCLADDEVVSAVQAIEQLGRKIDGLRVRAAGEAAERSRTADRDHCLASRHGCRNAVELLQRVTLASARTVKQRLRLAEAVRDRVSLTGESLPPQHPAVAVALRDGTLPLESAARITGMLGGLPGTVPPPAVACAEASLVASATGAPQPGPDGDAADARSDEVAAGVPEHADSIRVMCRVWRSALDQDGPAPSDAVVQQRRFFTLGLQRDGVVPLRGAVLPEVAALLGRLIDAVNSPRTAVDGGDSAGDDTGRDSGARSDTGADNDADDDAVRTEIADAADGRTPAQKRHDALAIIAQTAARHPDTPLLGGAPVTVLIQTTESALSGEGGTAWLHDHMGEIVPASPEVVHHAVCSGAVERVLRDEYGKIVGLGTNGRVFNAAQRRAITIRDGGCVIPGCTVPASWCEIHHVIPYTGSGPTHIDNGAMLCWHHHRTLETSGWHVSMINGVPHTKAPSWIDRARLWRRARPPAQAIDLRC